MKSPKAIPFIDTMLNEEYRIFLTQAFTVDVFLYTVKGWTTYDQSPYFAKYTNSFDKSTIEFFGHATPYKITNPKLVGDKTFMFPFPKNLDQFVCDCERCFVDLHWNESVENIIDKKYMMKQTEIQAYYELLLTKIEKL